MAHNIFFQSGVYMRKLVYFLLVCSLIASCTTSKTHLIEQKLSIDTEIQTDLSFDINSLKNYVIVNGDQNSTNLQDNVLGYFKYSLQKLGFINNNHDPDVLVIIRSQKSKDSQYIPAHTIEVPYVVNGISYRYDGNIGFSTIAGTKDKYIPESVENYTIYTFEISVFDLHKNMKNILMENAVYVKRFTNYEDDISEYMKFIDQIIEQKPFIWK
jgi:hypothetical protein